jgi:ADP-dependent NAD(P)H-hydrate dehydratase / NAD(P)H-hydrate epimerase
MKIFSSQQIKEIDEYTVIHEPVSSIDLMERAARQLFKWITDKFGRSQRFVIFAGPGNNGGDGLALARMLFVDRYDVSIHYISISDKTSGDWKLNRQRLDDETKLRLNILTKTDQFPVITSGDIIIDAIFGSGLTHQVDGLAKEVIIQINSTDAVRISIDIPSGLFGEDNSNNSCENVVKADYTLSFQFPKLSFMFAENSQCTGEWIILPIGLNNNVIQNTVTQFFYTVQSDIAPIIKTRNRFDHKGNYGHGLLVSGSTGKMGAAVLGARAALRTGIGLLTCHIPSGGNIILQSSVPEAMASLDKSPKYVSGIGNVDAYNAVGIGPGLGTHPETQKAIFKFLSECRKPLVIDADALNILALNKEWLLKLVPGTILTPHPKEFERLAGKADSSYDRLKKQIVFSATYNCIVVLKGANSSVSIPDGRVFFNSTGNPGMATGGSGDVLTGIILSLLAQGYTPENAAILGVYLHGLAGDLAAGMSCYESILATDIINNIGNAFNSTRKPDTES